MNCINCSLLPVPVLISQQCQLLTYHSLIDILGIDDEDCCDDYLILLPAIFLLPGKSVSDSMMSLMLDWIVWIF